MNKSNTKNIDLLKAPILPSSDVNLFRRNYDKELVCKKYISPDIIAGTKVSFRLMNLAVRKSFLRPIVVIGLDGHPRSEENLIEAQRVEEVFVSKNTRCPLVISIKARLDLDKVVPNFNNNGGVHLEVDNIWDYFERPVDKTVKELAPDQYAHNLEVLSSLEDVHGFQYYAGQKEYLARFAIKDFGIGAGKVGTGKTLKTISMIQLKGAMRTLVIAPKGCVKSDKNNLSQWRKELERFCPQFPVYELYSYTEYKRLKDLNGGQLPFGVYLSYYEAMFYKSAFTKGYSCELPVSDSGNEAEITKHVGKVATSLTQAGFKRNNPKFYENVGRKIDGIRCLATSSLATAIGHEFDMVCLDEAHKICKESSTMTDIATHSLRPKYRYAFTATPIPNTVGDLHSVGRWVLQKDRDASFSMCMDHKGFSNMYLSHEKNLTKDLKAKQAGKKSSSRKPCPILSRSLQLSMDVQSFIAHIDKPECNPNYVRPVIKDIRVPMGEMQAKVYVENMSRPVKHLSPMVMASLMNTRLWTTCVDPRSGWQGKSRSRIAEPKSNLTPKIVATFNVLWKCLQAGEQCVIINSRNNINDEMAERLTACGVSFSRIDGTTNNHATESANFKAGKTQVMLMGLKCAAGYSYDQCPNLIISSLEYSYGSFSQALGRVDRVTSKGSRIFCILVAGSIEEIMFSTIKNKGSSAEFVLQGKPVPFDFKPVDSAEVLSKALMSIGDLDIQAEAECDKQWGNLILKFNSLLLTNSNEKVA